MTDSVGARIKDLFFLSRFFGRKLKYPFVFLEEVVFPPGNLLKMSRIVLKLIYALLQPRIFLFKHNILLLNIFEF